MWTNMQGSTRNANSVVLYLSASQPVPPVPFELQSQFPPAVWSMRLTALTNASKAFAKPLFERAWALMGLLSMIIVPAVVYNAIYSHFHVRDENGRLITDRLVEARLISMGLFIGVVLLFIIPIGIWKFIGYLKLKRMTDQWVKSDRMNFGQNAVSWRVKTPSIFRDRLILIIGLPANQAPSNFNPNAYLPSYIGQPTDGNDSYYYPYKPEPGLPRMSVVGNVPLYFDEKKGFEDVKVVVISAVSSSGPRDLSELGVLDSPKDMKKVIAAQEVTGSSLAVAAFSLKLSSLHVPSVSASPSLVKRADNTTEVPTVYLNYTTVQASTYNESVGFAVYSNIRFAQPPVGDLRWAAPQPPLNDSTVRNGTWSTNGTRLHGGRGLLIPRCLGPNQGQQDKKLPVFVFVYGGGYSGGSKGGNTPEGLFARSDNGILFIAANYRLGFLGFANGATIQKNGVDNAGFHDVRATLEWIQEYIEEFGGDPNQVTVGGQIYYQIAAYGGEKDLPFQRAIAMSGAGVLNAGHAWPEYFENLSSIIGCASQTSTAPTRKFSATSTHAPSAVGFTLQPMSDGDFAPNLCNYGFNIGKFNKNVQLMIEHESNTRNYATVTTEQDFRQQLRAIFPSMRESVIASIEQEYDITSKALPPAKALNGETYNYVSHLGSATHGSDQSYAFYGQDTSASMDGDGGSEEINEEIAITFQQYLVSFIITGDPNAKFSNFTNWPKYGSEGNVLAINDTSGLSIVSDELDTEAVRFWNTDTRAK
ncbi:hypothetical protein D9758_001992 [Tetrapyrgos nigripes]|uniref:Carboxylesterase type B domain-containing protein n=1 Tax=Tetrapyrgos nigripes TaxID=182062 RepID=A0A8H5GTP2_9AGAR|nr:hypothetical protein D9758_001992 [Tetrapyrgos nigripes]